MQHKRDEREAPATILARLNERLDLLAQLLGGAIANQPARALQDVPVAQRIDLRLDFLEAPPQPRGQARSVENGIRIAVEEYKDVPRQERPDVTLDELCDRGSENPS